MKKLPLLALLVLLVAAVGLLAWMSRQGSTPQASDVALATLEKQPASDTASGGAPKLESDAGGEALSPNDQRTEAARKAEDEGTWDPALSVWLSGSVRTSCVDDGPLEVFALSSEVDADALASLAASHEKIAKLSGRPRIVSRRTVSPDGTFRLDLPPGTKTAQVSVLGRYHYLSKSQTVDITAVHDLVLTPECGACIVGSITTPPAFEVKGEDVAAGAANDTEGLKVSLASALDGMRGSIMSMDRVKRSVQVHERAFEFRALPVAGGYEMTVEPEKLAAARVSARDLPAGRSTPIEIALLRGGTIRGTVRDSDGKPVAQAKVEAALPGRWFGFDNKTVRETASSDQGAFELAAVTPGRIILRATRPSFLDSDPLKLDLADGAAVNDAALVLTQGKSVSGKLAWSDGSPAAGIAIDLKFDMSQMYGMGAFNALRGAKGSAETRADGAFEIGGLGDGPFTLEAEAPPREAGAPAEDDAALAPAASAPAADDKASVSSESSAETGKKGKRDKSTFWRARADGIAGGSKDVSMVLRAPEGVAGKVVDESGAPIAKFRLDATRMGKGPLASLGQEKRNQSFEDAGGAFLLGGLEEGHWKLVAGAEGFALSDALEIDIPKPHDAQPVTIAMVHGASIKGWVKTPDGAPIADAEIAVDNGKPNWQNMLDSASAAPKAKSLPDGTFVIDGLKPGKTALYAKHKKFARSASVAFDLAPAQHAEGAEIVLREGGTLTGEVFGDGGAPSVGFMVQASETKIFDQQMTFTDGRGQFEIEHLEPGTWQVVAMPTGNDASGTSDSAASGDRGSGGDRQQGMMDMMSKMKTTIVDIKDGEKTHVVLGAPPADPVKVHGRVTHAGEPYSGSMLSFVAEGKGRLKGLKTTQVDKDGNYSVQLDEPGNYVVTVQKILGTGQQNAVEFASEIPKEKDYKLDFALPTARISGRVLGPEGDPAPGTRVSLHPESAITLGTMWGGQYSETATDGEGRFDIPALRPGRYSLMVGGMMLGGLFGDDGALGRQVKGDLHLSEGEWMKDVDFRLKKAGAVDVQVVDEAGAPVGEAALFARNKDGKLLDRFSMITTDANGKCKYGGLEPGTYFLSARKGSAASPDSSQVRVEEGQRASVKIVLQSATVLIVDVFDGENKPVKASLSVQDEDGREVGGMIALSEIMKMFSEGGFSGTQQKIGPLPPGKYHVRATLADGKALTKPVTLSGQPERTLSIHFM